MPSARCWKLAACRQARSKRGDLPSKARNAVVSDIRKTELSEIRELAQKNWWNSRSRQWNAFLCEREEQVFLVLTLFIGALVGVVVVAFILVTSRFGARLYPAGGAAWRRLLVPVAGSAVMGYLLFRFFPDARGSGVPQTKAALYARGGRISLGTVFRKFFCTSARGSLRCLAEVSGCVLRRCRRSCPWGRQPRSQRHSIHRSQQCCSRLRKWSEIYTRRCSARWCWPRQPPGRCFDCSWEMIRCFRCRNINWSIRGDSESMRYSGLLAASSRPRLRSCCFGCERALCVSRKRPCGSNPWRAD